MIIFVKRSGGFAGMTLESEIDTEQLEPQERQDIHDLVESSEFFERELNIDTSQTGADRFHYELMIEKDEKQRSVELDENQIPVEWQPLFREIDLLARRFRK